MSNKSSKIGYIPQRSCVICRKKAEKKELMRFVLLDNEIVFDRNSVLGKRGYYVCNFNDCLQKLDNWMNRKLRNKQEFEWKIK